MKGIFVNALVIVKLPLGPFRAILAWPISLILRWQLLVCERLMSPILETRIEERNDYNDADGTTLDAIESTFNLYPEEAQKEHVSRLSKELLHTLWAGSSAPGGMMTEVLYQLLMHPEHMAPLRDEALYAIKKHGWSEKMIGCLPLQDSFIREVNRLFPTGSSTRNPRPCDLVSNKPQLLVYA